MGTESCCLDEKLIHELLCEASSVLKKHSLETTMKMEEGKQGRKENEWECQELRDTLRDANNFVKLILQAKHGFFPLKSLVEALVRPALLNNPNPELQALVLSCISELLRIYAPRQPWNDAQMQSIFTAMISQFKQMASQDFLFKSQLNILINLARFKCLVVMLDHDFCDSLLIQTVSHLLEAVHRNADVNKYELAHGSIQVILYQLITECDVIPDDLMQLLNTLFTKDSEVESPRKLFALKLIEQLPKHLKPFFNDPENETVVQNPYRVQKHVVLALGKPPENKDRKAERKEFSMDNGNQMKPPSLYLTDPNEKGLLVTVKEEQDPNSHSDEVAGSYKGSTCRRVTKMKNANIHGSNSRRNKREREEEMVGRRIKVWWPLDKTFYQGRVKSYNFVTGKHTVIYDDGEKETLNMTKQKYELLD